MLEITIILTVAGLFLSNKSQLYTYGSVEKTYLKTFFLYIFFHWAVWLQTKDAITLFEAC